MSVRAAPGESSRFASRSSSPVLLRDRYEFGMANRDPAGFRRIQGGDHDCPLGLTMRSFWSAVSSEEAMDVVADGVRRTSWRCLPQPIGVFLCGWHTPAGSGKHLSRRELQEQTVGNGQGVDAAP